jgi:hypothetical protein
VTGTSTGDIVVANDGAQFTSGFLETFLGHPGVLPPNPLNAFIGATQTVQAGATGYYVLTADVGNYTLGGQSDPLADIFSLNPAVFASGSLILANLFEENGEIISTAQSSAKRPQLWPVQCHAGARTHCWCRTPRTYRGLRWPSSVGAAAAAEIRLSRPKRGFAYGIPGKPSWDLSPRFHQRGFFVSAARHRNHRLGSMLSQRLAADAEPVSW